MAEPVRIGLDGCALPSPIDGTQEYLAAIFDELRALRTGKVPASDDGKAAPAPEVEPVPQPVMISEPERPDAPDVHALIEEAAEAGEPVPTSDQTAAQKTTRRRPSSRKRAK